MQCPLTGNAFKFYCAQRAFALIRMTHVSRVQGVIVAAPVFAATGSRWKAMGIAIASVRLLNLLRNSVPQSTAQGLSVVVTLAFSCIAMTLSDHVQLIRTMVLVSRGLTYQTPSLSIGRAAGIIRAAGRADCAALRKPAADAPAPALHARLCGRHHGESL